jgi:hypothetical protein
MNFVEYWIMGGCRDSLAPAKIYNLYHTQFLAEKQHFCAFFLTSSDLDSPGLLRVVMQTIGYGEERRSRSSAFPSVERS